MLFTLNFPSSTFMDEVPLSNAPNPQLSLGLWIKGCPLLRVYMLMMSVSAEDFGWHAFVCGRQVIIRFEASLLIVVLMSVPHMKKIWVFLRHLVHKKCNVHVVSVTLNCDLLKPKIKSVHHRVEVNISIKIWHAPQDIPEILPELQYTYALCPRSSKTQSLTMIGWLCQLSLWGFRN